MLGYIPVNRTLLKIIWRGKATESPHKSNIWAEMPSEPAALLGFSLQTNETILLVDIGNCSSRSFVLYVKAGNTLPVVTGVHCLQK